MTLFLIVAEDDSDPLDLNKIVLREFPDAYQINKRCWVVSLKGITAEKIALKLGVSGEGADESEGTQGVVVFRSTPSYWGSANTKLWDWLKANLEKSDG